MNERAEQAEPGFFDRLRARYGWLDHVVRAYTRFDERHGSFFAAGLTYYTILALSPLLMVTFSAIGFLLIRQTKLRNTIYEHIMASVPGHLSHQMIDLMNRAIGSRTSVGVIGLATAAWAGLGWMSHLRAALTEMWWEHRVDSPGYVRTKLSDLLAMVGTFVVMLATIGLSALSHAEPMAAVLRWFGIPEFSVFDDIFRVVSILMSMLVSWLLFTWMIARLPREKVSFVDSMRAGLVAAVGFELFKQGASIYLTVVTRSPAGRVFGPVLGLMVFAYITSFLVLFATAWGATASVDPRAKPVDPPAPAIIAPRVQLEEGLSTRQTVAAMVVGAVGALTLSRLMHWRR
jgi:membrane protein